MDTTDPEITFDLNGVCNHCSTAKKLLPNFHFSKDQEEKNLISFAEMVKRNRVKGSAYDSIIGLSGGVDSSYVAYLARKLELNPLAVHFDNGWNSEISVSNIKKIVSRCKFDLETYVIDWPEFRDLQRSFFKAGVVDVEILTDHAIMATMFKLRKKHKIDTILSGTNFTTEHGLPKAWVWNKQDLRNIRAIQKRFGTKRLKAFPTLSTFRLKMITAFGFGGTYLEPLNQINYRKNDAMASLENEFEWQYYGGKHYESVFTKFYQAYYLVEKFGFDKRKVHLSAQIRNGEISREEAVEALRKPSYDPLELKRDKAYVLKKLGFSDTEFEEIMKTPPKKHEEYPNEEWVLTLASRIKSIIRPR